MITGFPIIILQVVCLFTFQYTIASCGMSDEDLSKLKQVLEAVPDIPAICLDVANGYSEHFVEFVKTVRSHFPYHIIMVGNVNNVLYLIVESCYLRL